jgi:hypothetical protein
MRRKLIVGLLLLNGLLGAALFSGPAQTQVRPTGFFHCCKLEGSDPYCCANCCWFAQNCMSSSDCLDVEGSGS